jgi:hypothetical protein
LHAARAHVVNVSIGVLAAVFFAMQEVCEGNMASSIHVHHRRATSVCKAAVTNMRSGRRRGLR